MLSTNVKRTMATALSGAAIASTALVGGAQARLDAPLTAKSPQATVGHRCDPAAIIGVISFCNPAGHSRGPGAGAGRL